MALAKYKLLALIDVINSKLIGLPSGSSFNLSRTRDLDGIYAEEELDRQLLKLQDDEKVLKVRLPRPPEYREDEDHELYSLAVDNVTYQAYVKDLYLREFPTLYLNGLSELEQKTNGQKTNVVYEIIYTPSREIIVNKILQLASLDFDSTNDAVFSFLYNNPNKKFTKKELENATKKTISDLHKIVEQLGFIGQLRNVFISVSKDTICFKNPITKIDLEQQGLIRIEPIIKPKKA